MRRVDVEHRTGLEEAWRAAEAAARRTGGELRGVIRTDSVVSPEASWLAWSKSPDERPVEGAADTPEEALVALVRALGTDE